MTELMALITASPVICSSQRKVHATKRGEGVPGDGLFSWKLEEGSLDGSNMLWPAAAASPDGIHQVVIAEGPNLLRHLRALLVVTPHGVGQPRIGIAEDVAVGALAEIGHVLVHVRGPQSTVESHGKGLGVADAVPECLVRLTTQGATCTDDQY
jgi:hypothetical protein